MSLAIRPAGFADVPEIQSIYAHHVLHGTGSFEEQPPSVEEMADRFGRVVGRGWAWLVAVDATGDVFIVGSTSSTCAAPSSRTRAGTTFSTSRGVLTVGGVVSPVVTVGSGARWARATCWSR